VSRITVTALLLVALGGTVLGIVAYEAGRDSGDGQEALVLPFVAFWTVVALAAVWGLDRLIRNWRR
jgi:hypothetical protein